MRKPTSAPRTEEDARARQLQLLARVARRIHEADQVPEILNATLEELQLHFDSPAVWLFWGETSQGLLHLAAQRGLSESYLRHIDEHGLSECLCPQVFEQGQGMLARNTVDCPRMPHLIEGINRPVPHACIPLALERERRGVLNVASPSGRNFTEDELSFLETVGHQVCLAVERVRQLRAVDARNQQLEAMVNMNHALGGSLDSTEILEAVAEQARELLDADTVVCLLGERAEELTVAHLPDRATAQLRMGQRIDLADLDWQPVADAFERRRYTELRGSSASKVLEDLGAKSGLAIPLASRSELLGICVAGRATVDSTEEERLIAEGLAAQTAIALENAHLYQEAREAYRRLREAQERAIESEKMAVVGNFAAGLAHEVRNPLNSIALQLSVLERRIADFGEDQAAQAAERAARIRQEIERLDELVSDFLAFSRHSQIPTSSRDLRVISEDVVTLLRPEAQARRISLTCRGLDEPIPVRVDPDRIKQVIINLVRNALQALVETGSVELLHARDGDKAVLTVKDTGPGVPEEVDVFGIFVTTREEGTGLGLAIARQVVLEHRGSLEVSSKPGDGAAFRVTLPLAEADALNRELVV